MLWLKVMHNEMEERNVMKWKRGTKKIGMLYDLYVTC